MYTKNTGKIFEIDQIAGKRTHLPTRAYCQMAQPQALLTSSHNQAVKQQERGGVSQYYEAFLDLNNFEIVEYTLVEKTRHKHPLSNKESV